MNTIELKKMIGNRDVFIWGTRISGLSAAKILPHYNIEVKGFVDSISGHDNKLNLDVISPDDLFSNRIKNKFVIICTRGHSPHIVKTCIENNLTRNDFIEWEKIQKFDYYIEINNKCNLSCLSCSVRQFYNDNLHDMSISDFESVLNKIRKEDPFTSWINLFGHNEAFLNKSLAEMIKIANEYNFSVGLSTNLACSKNFEDVIKAKPLWVRVSMSGWGSNYEIIHKGGNFNLLLKNLRLLSKYRSEHSKETMVEIFFHRYKHNAGDIENIKQLCKELSFEYRAIYASLIGLETVSNILDGRPVSLKTQKAYPYLCYSIEETAALAFKQKNYPCPNDHLVRIHSDLTVAECQAWMGSVLPGIKFPEISLNELEKKLINTKYCSICKPRGLHQFCEVVFDEKDKNEELD